MWGLPLPTGLFEERFGTPGNGVFGIPPRSTIGGGVPPIGRGGFGLGRGGFGLGFAQNPEDTAFDRLLAGRVGFWALQDFARSCGLLRALAGLALAGSDGIPAGCSPAGRYSCWILPDGIPAGLDPAGAGGMAFLAGRVG